MIDHILAASAAAHPVSMQSSVCIPRARTSHPSNRRSRAVKPFEAGRSSLSGRQHAAQGLITKSGKYVVIYKRVDGQWKIAYDIFNDD